MASVTFKNEKCASQLRTVIHHGVKPGSSVHARMKHTLGVLATPPAVATVAVTIRTAIAIFLLVAPLLPTNQGAHDKSSRNRENKSHKEEETRGGRDLGYIFTILLQPLHRHVHNLRKHWRLTRTANAVTKRFEQSNIGQERQGQGTSHQGQVQ